MTQLQMRLFNVLRVSWAWPHRGLVTLENVFVYGEGKRSKLLCTGWRDQQNANCQLNHTYSQVDFLGRMRGLEHRQAKCINRGRHVPRDSCFSFGCMFQLGASNYACSWTANSPNCRMRIICRRKQQKCFFRSLHLLLFCSWQEMICNIIWQRN